MNSNPTSFNRRQLLRRKDRDRNAIAGHDSRSQDPGRADLVRAHRPAMGSYFEVRVPANTPGGVELACRALDVIDSLEAQLTVYRDDSEVSQLNERAHHGPVEVDRGLFALLETAFALSAETEGAYDVAAGALSEAWGFVRGPKRVPEPATLAEARARTGWHHVRLDRKRQTVAFDRPGVRINLGSIGKGHAIDRAVDLIRGHWWPTPALVHGGQSSLFALGSPAGTIGGRWEIALRNPFDPESPLGTLRLRNRGLGTSGISFQHFVFGGKSYGHLIDPRTGAPAESGPASLTVLAPTAAFADALSTAFYLLGPEAAGHYVKRHPEIGMIFVEEGDAPQQPRLRLFGIGESDFVPAGNAINSGDS